MADVFLRLEVFYSYIPKAMYWIGIRFILPAPWIQEIRFMMEKNQIKIYEI